MRTYTMHNFATGKTVRKTQRTRPVLRGYTCVSSVPVLPAFRGGRKLVWDANNKPRYVEVDENGFHRE